MFNYAQPEPETHSEQIFHRVIPVYTCQNLAMSQPKSIHIFLLCTHADCIIKKKIKYLNDTVSQRSQFLFLKIAWMWLLQYLILQLKTLFFKTLVLTYSHESEKVGYFSYYIPEHCSSQCLQVFDKRPTTTALGDNSLHYRNCHRTGIFQGSTFRCLFIWEVEIS